MYLYNYSFVYPCPSADVPIFWLCDLVFLNKTATNCWRHIRTPHLGNICYIHQNKQSSQYLIINRLQYLSLCGFLWWISLTQRDAAISGWVKTTDVIIIWWSLLTSDWHLLVLGASIWRWLIDGKWTKVVLTSSALTIFIKHTHIRTRTRDWWDSTHVSVRKVATLDSMQLDEDLNRSKPVVAIGLSRVISLLLVLIWIYSDVCLYYSYIIHTVY